MGRVRASAHARFGTLAVVVAVVAVASGAGPAGAALGVTTVDSATNTASFGTNVPTFVADVNGDGTDDVVTVDYSGQTIVSSLGHGGVFSEVTTPAVFTPQADSRFAPLHAVTYDVDGDGVLDVVSGMCRLNGGTDSCADSDFEKLRGLGWARGLGDGTFAPPEFLTTPAGQVAVHQTAGQHDFGYTFFHLETGDLTGDGRDDLIAWNSNFGAPGAVIFPGLAGGGVGDPVSLALPDQLDQVAVAHVDGDGVDDLLVTHQDSSFHEVVQAVIGGPTPTVLPAQTAPNDFRLDATGDVDGDGKDDVAGLHTEYQYAPPALMSGGPTAGTITQADSTRQSLSATGRYVAMEAFTTVPPSREVVIRDRDADGNGVYDETDPGSVALVTVSVAADGGPADGVSFLPFMSADGRFVAFDSLASNLVDGDVNGAADAFVHDRDLDGNGVFDEPGPGKTKTVMVSVTDDGTQPTPLANTPFVGGISDDGRFVAFGGGSDYDPSTPKGPCSSTFPFVHDRDADGNGTFDEPHGITTRNLNVAPGNVAADGCAFDAPIVSSDGRYAAFISTATNLVAGDTNTTVDAFVVPLAGGPPVRVSVSPSGAEAPDAAVGRLSMSANGQKVAWITGADALVPGDSNGQQDVVVRDRDADGNGVFDELGGVSMVVASSAADGTQADSSSDFPSLSRDGSKVAFVSLATNLTDDPAQQCITERHGDQVPVVCPEVFVRNLDSPSLVRVSTERSNHDTAGLAEGASLSDFGEVAFMTDASLVPDDTNGSFDVYVGTLSPAFVGATTRPVVWRSNGDGSFAAAVPIPASVPGRPDLSFVSLHDVTGDGDNDLLFHAAGYDDPDHSTIQLFVLDGNGDGTFGPLELVGDAPFPRALEFGDFDGDGDTDIHTVGYDASFNQTNRAFLLDAEPVDTDADGDGVEDAIGTGGGGWSDAIDGHETTVGSIVSVPPGLSVSVTDAPDPAGVRVTVSGSGAGNAELSACGLPVEVSPGSEVVLTCASVIADVVQGSATVVLGDGVTVSVPAGVTAEVADLGGGSFSVDVLPGSTGSATVTRYGQTSLVGADDPPVTVTVVPPPDTSITAGPDEGSATRKTNATVKFASTGDPATFACAVDGRPWSACVNKVQLADLADGVHSVAVRSTVGGVTDPTPAVRSWTVDRVDPVIAVAVPLADAVFPVGSVVNASFSCDDPGGSGVVDCSGPATVDTSAAGKPSFQVQATDAAGNTAKAKVRYQVVEPPETKLQQGPKEGDAVTVTSASFGLASPGEPTATFECSLDSAPWAPCTEPVTSSGLADGVHTFAARAVAFGLVDPTPATRSWRVDTVGPQVVVTSPAEGATYAKNQNVVPSYACTDPGGSGVKKCTGPATVGTGSKGAKTYVVKATDQAGNDTTITIHYTVGP